MIKTTLTIEGMACSMCESHVNDAVRRNFNVKKIRSSHRKGTTEIISEFPLDEKALADTIGKTGYTVRKMTTVPYEKRRFPLTFV